MSTEQYLLMCEQMGWEPKEEDMPLEVDSLSYEAQCALILFNALPDNWEGMSGSWMGKDYSGLMDIMNIYEMDNKKAIFQLLKSAEAEASKFYAQKQKERDAMAKAKSRSR